MTSEEGPSPTETRTRDKGLSPLDWSAKPTADEAQFDNLRLKVTGTVEWGPSGSFTEYVSNIGGSIYFGAPGTIGRSYRSSLRGLTTLSGELSLRMRSAGRADERKPGQATFELELSANPTRSRALAIRRSQRALADLAPVSFFSPLPTPDEAFPAVGRARSEEEALDGADNILLGTKELGGTSRAARHKSRDEFLAVYEHQLKRLIMDA